MKPLGNVPGPLAYSDIHRHHHQVGKLLGQEVVGQDGQRGQFVHRNVEESLDLAGVQVHCKHPVGAGGGQKVGHQPRGYGNPRLVLFISAAIAIVRNDCSDPTCRGPLAGVDHDQQLHQVVVHRGAGWLNDKNVPLADVFVDTDEGVIVGELENIRLSQRDIQVVANRFGQLPVGVSG